MGRALLFLPLKWGAKIRASEGFPSAVFEAMILRRRRGRYIPLRMGVWEGVKNDLPWVVFGVLEKSLVERAVLGGFPYPWNVGVI